jgi:glycosyltransferase involved in cell wall biosynthesis
MKVVIVGTAYPLRGGISHYNALLYRELSKSHEVDVVTFKRQYPALLFPGKTQTEAGGEMLRIPSEQLVDSINPLNWISVGKNIRQRKPDLLLFKYWLPFFGPCFGRIARTVKRGTPTKMVYICDNVVPHERRPGDAAFTRYAFKPADGFIVQSDAVEKDLLRFWPGARYKKIPHPVYNIFGEGIAKHEARRRLGITSERIILFFGYVRAYKGLDVLLDAMADLINVQSIHLLVVGEFYDNESKYRRQIERLGLGKHVTVFSEYVPNDQVGVFFSACDIVVLPYVSATQSGIAQIAYNFDKPVIATNVGGLGEVVHDGVTGYLLPPNDPQALAENILRFYREGREAEFVRNVRMEKQKYTWAAMVEAIEELTLT